MIDKSDLDYAVNKVRLSKEKTKAFRRGVNDCTAIAGYIDKRLKGDNSKFIETVWKYGRSLTKGLKLREDLEKDPKGFDNLLQEAGWPRINEGESLLIGDMALLNRDVEVGCYYYAGNDIWVTSTPECYEITRKEEHLLNPPDEVHLDLKSEQVIGFYRCKLD